MNVKFYMKRDGVDSSDVDLESSFQGMKYSKCDGLEDLGKPKNIYTETYADADTLRVHIPQSGVTREATTITFTFFFFGNNRQDIYDKFNAFVKGNKIYYYDTARQKRAYMVLMDKTAPKEDIYKGSHPYISVDYKFQNLWGECRDINQNPVFVLTGSSSTAVIGKSISFTATLNGVVLDTGDVALYVDGVFVKTGDAGANYIVYQPTATGNHTAQVKYDYNGTLLTSNYWDFKVS